MTQDFLFTSESVTEGHPDKMADQVSDAVLDAMLSKDKHARCAIETLFKTGFCIVAGEVRTTGWVDIPAVVRQTIQSIGYTSSETGFDGLTCGVLVAIEGQSSDISLGVDAQGEREQGAGDQGMMFGFACDETEEYMPMPIGFAHKLSKRLAHVRKTSILPWIRPDGKTQVSVRYENNRPVGIETIVVSTQHHPDVSWQILQEGIIEEVIHPIVPQTLRLPNIRYLINPTGQFTVGGPMGDTGVTGRKIIVDTYGGMGHHGGGAFSGKDPSKVDRSAAYLARYIAKNLVAADVAKRCEVQLAYAIGVSEPVSLLVHTFGTSKIKEQHIEQAVRAIFPLKPALLIEHLQLLRPIYQPTATYGHFGRNEPTFTWEQTDMVSRLQEALL